MMEKSGTTRDGRDRIGMILYTLYIAFLLLSVAICLKIIYIQFFYKTNYKIQRALTPQSVSRSVSPVRGNILDCNGNLLAGSTPTYLIGMDCTVRKAEFKAIKDRKTAEKKENEWRMKAKELSKELSNVFPGKSWERIYTDILEARDSDKRYICLGNPVDKATYERIKTFPLFNEGGNRGGLTVEKNDVRVYPYGTLARRTIGFVRSNALKDVTNNNIGLEGKYNDYLHGKEGHDWLRRTDFGYIQDFDSTRTAAEDGMNLVTTLNIDYQDIADGALREQIADCEDLEGACLVLMEVSTGAIRAMVNLTRDVNGNFREISNHAVGRKMEPGSVFKTVTLMSVLQDGFVKSLDETIETNKGVVKYVKKPKVDDHVKEYEKKHGDRISILHGFAISSNYVFGTLAVSNYRNAPEKFTRRLVGEYHLSGTFDFDIEGFADGFISTPDNTKNWSNSTLNTLGFGYSSELTPLHILTFYNAIAGKGRMMKPYLVESVCKRGKMQRRKPEELNGSICRKDVADTLTRALKSVTDMTEEGTARYAMKGIKCPIAGKTGTSFLTYSVDGKTRYHSADGKRGYQGTFVGFFPADDPQYSIICTIFTRPTSKSYQGAGIPARAVRTVVDELYCIDPYFRPKLSKLK